MCSQLKFMKIAEKTYNSKYFFNCAFSYEEKLKIEEI